MFKWHLKIKNCCFLFYREFSLLHELFHKCLKKSLFLEKTIRISISNEHKFVLWLAESHINRWVKNTEKLKKKHLMPFLFEWDLLQICEYPHNNFFKLRTLLILPHLTTKILRKTRVQYSFLDISTIHSCHQYGGVLYNWINASGYAHMAGKISIAFKHVGVKFFKDQILLLN